MKNLFILIFSGFLVLNIKAQNPTGTPPANNTTSQAAAAWYRGGNIQNGLNNNIFGTQWNSPIYTITNGNYRMRLNGQTDNYIINNVNSGVKPGYLLIGRPLNGMFTLTGAFSQFHVTGLNPTQFGYRPWMETGTTYTANSDLSYFGIRSIDNINDLTEHVICWSNDVNPLAQFPNPNPAGPDDMVFRFTNEINALGNISPFIQTINQTNFNIANDLDGRHVARFTATGEMGLGNTFGVNSPSSGGVYVRPKSLAHLSTSVLDTVWMQFTNRNTQLNT